jgi:CBS domain containing-hemolysin-like protein
MLGAGVLILVNGLFVAYEFALIAAKRSTFEADAETGKRIGKAAVASFSDLSLQLAGAQLGITMASLALGYVGEPAVAGLVEQLLGPVLSEEVNRVVSFGVALSVVVFLHLVIGEMVPKNIAIAKPEMAVRWLILPYRAYLFVTRPMVLLLNTLANAGCRLLGIEPRDELVSSHTAAELATIITGAFEDGSIESESAELLHGVLEFAQRPVVDVASSLSDIAMIRFGSTPAQAERVIRTSGQTRLPVMSSALGERRLVGYLHAKDLLAIDRNDRFTPIPADLYRPMVLVRAERSLIEVLRTLRGLRRQLAVVLDDEGPVAVVSVEQIIRALIESHSDADV